jgi:hypothetical protein
LAKGSADPSESSFEEEVVVEEDSDEVWATSRLSRVANSGKAGVSGCSDKSAFGIE